MTKVVDIVAVLVVYYLIVMPAKALHWLGRKIRKALAP